MADEGTAVLDAPDTAVGEVTPPQLDAAPETDTESLAPETGSAPDTPETAEPDPLAGLDPETIQKAIDQNPELLKAHEARWRESERRKAEAAVREAQYQQRSERAFQLAQGEALQRIHGIAKAVEEGREFNPQWAAQLSADLASAAFHEQAEAIQEEVLGYLATRFPQWRVPPAATEYIARAWHKGDRKAMVDSMCAVLEFAVGETMAPRMKAALEADLRKKAEAAQKTERMREAEAKRPDGPTVGLGTASGPVNNRQALDSAMPGSAQWRAAYRAEYGIDPP